MSDNMSWKEMLYRLKNPIVRDLYWSVASPCPINEDLYPDLLFPKKKLNEIIEEHQSFFLGLDDDPAILHNFLERELKSYRLGFYFEALLLFFFKTSKTIDLLISNKQIFDGKITRGEIDFIIKWKGEVYHIESSVKFYLNRGEVSTFNDWIGPQNNDTLNKKIEKVINHQFPIAQSKEVLNEIGKPFKSFLWLKGRFYSNNSLPTWKNKHCDFGTYQKYENGIKKILEGEKEIFVLTKPNWLADLDLVNEKLKVSKVDFLNIVELAIENKKALHIATLDNNIVKTSFLVSNNWQN